MATPITPVMTAEIIAAIYAAIGDVAKASGVFDKVDDHEVRNPPGNGLTALVLLGPLAPIRSSGLPIASARLEFTVRIESPRLAEPDGETDRAVLYAGAYLMAAYNADFELKAVPDGLVRMVDVYGAYGDGLKFEPGWLGQSGAPFRVGEVTVPLILNDVFPQGA